LPETSSHCLSPPLRFGEGVRGRGRSIRTSPQVEEYRLARREPAEALQGHVAIGRAEILAEGKVGVVGRQRSDGAGVACRDADLRGERVGLDVEAARARPMLVADLLRPGDVEKRVRLAVETEQLLFRHAVAATTRVVTAECPAPLEAMCLKDRGHRGDV